MDSIEFRLRLGWIGRLLRYVGKRGIHDNGLDSFFFSAWGSENTRDTLSFSVSANCTQLEFTDLLGAGYILTREFLCFYVFFTSRELSHEAKTLI